MCDLNYAFKIYTKYALIFLSKMSFIVIEIIKFYLF